MDIELLSISLRPRYLPREFPQVFITLVYIHPQINVEIAEAIIQQETLKLQSISPDAPIIILGDMNSCTLSKSLRDFSQYVSCPTRKANTLDLCYGNIKGAYKAFPLPPLGKSDHICIHLVPVYRTALQRGGVTSITIKD